MTEVSASRSALSALSVNTAHNIQPSHNTRLSLSHKAHSSKQPASIHTSSFDTSTTTTTTSTKRTSLSSAKRQSLSSTSSTTRQSLLPSSQTTSRQSLSSSRHSLSHTNPSRPSSLTSKSGGGTSTTRADPRPLHDKSYLRTEITKIITYAATHHYHNPLSIKLLTSPSSKDFKQLILWLFQRVDPSFEWSEGGKEVEEDIKKMMRFFGYPFNVSKNALIAAGTPHTWPSLLVMIGWLVDFLSYDEVVNGWYESIELSEGTEAAEGTESGHDSMNGEFDTERCYFRYMCASYSAMMCEDNNATTKVEQQLITTFNTRTQTIEQDIVKLTEKQQELIHECETHQMMAKQVNELKKRRDNFITDKERFLAYQHEMETHLTQQIEKQTQKQVQLEERTKQKNELTNQQNELNEIIANQEFTPLQLQSMLHQQQLLTDTLADVAIQQTRATSEVYEVERSISERLTTLTQLVNEYNQLAVAVELVPSNARHANGCDYTLRMCEDEAKESGDGWVTPDAVTIVQPHLTHLHRTLTTTATTLTAQVRALHDEWARLSEHKTDHTKQLAATRQQCEKREESYKRDKEEMNTTLAQLIAQIEHMETKINDTRNSGQREAKERAEKLLAEVEAERVRREVEWRDVRLREQGAMWDAIEELVAHVERIHSVVGGLNGLAAAVKSAVEKPLEFDV